MYLRGLLLRGGRRKGMGRSKEKKGTERKNDLRH